MLAALRVLAVLGIAALTGWALSAASVWAGVAAGIFAVDAVLAVVAYRLVRYGTLRKPRVKARVNENLAALPAAPLAIEQARPVTPLTVVTAPAKVVTTSERAEQG